MYDEEEDVLAPKDPQVTSDKPEERKAARAIRIKKRQEALKKLEQLPEDVIVDDTPGPIEQATASAAEELQRLALEGNEKVTNVKVTADEREVIRRFKNIDTNKEFMDKMEAEANEAQIKYEVISSQWEPILQLNDPLDIDSEVRTQRAKCDLLMQQKNQLIQELKDELKHMDQVYCEDMEKQDQDIKELSDRVEKQVTIIQRAYEQQLFLIETAISLERTSMVEYNQKRWEALYKQRDREELAHMEMKFEQLEEFDIEIDKIGWEHHERYRATRTELETLVQELQKELEKLKAVCLINGEKIGYNYQVLKKREEENVFVRSQQKRKLNKMADVMNALRAKIRKAADDGALEEARGDVEIAKLKQAMIDLENKSAHFAHVNDYKLQQVWRMNVHRCMELSHEVRRCEVGLYSHVLAEPPPPPPPPPPHNPLRAASTGTGTSPDKNITKKVMSMEPIDENNTAAIEAKDNLVKHILSLVADNTGFLVENRLHELLATYPKSSRNLCFLDAIFNALEVHRDEDVEMLCKTFLTYAFCPICIGLDSMSDDTEQIVNAAQSHEESQPSRSVDRGRISHVHGAEKASVIRTRTSARSLSRSTSPSTHTHITFRSGYDPKLSESDQILMAEAGQILQQYTGPIASDVMGADHADSISGVRRARGVTVASDIPSVVASASRTRNPFLCSVGHTLEIEAMQVLAALGDFVSNFTPPEKEKLNNMLESVKPRDMSTASRNLLAQDVEDYWNKFRGMFPDAKDKLWTGMMEGLTAYLPVLQEREKLHEQVQELRRRNAALRSMVRGSLPELASAAPRPAPPPAYLRASPAAFNAPTPLM